MQKLRYRQKYIYSLIVISLLVLLFHFVVNIILFQLLNDRENISYETSLHWLKEEREGCLSCHSGMTGFEKSHDPNKIGCSACHLGNPSATNKEIAHNGMILIPGNADNAELTCGRTNCHPQMISRMKNNIMNSMNGVVSVDKWVWGEIASPTSNQPIQLIGFSPAEKHLRNLCASCHLSNKKTEFGPIGELSRGGGCLACHLDYSEDAFEELQDAIPLREGQGTSSKNSGKQKFAKYKFFPSIHPQINLEINKQKCFGCHSRSGRVSLSYEGWHETLLTKEEIKPNKKFRILEDGRVVTKIKADIHYEKGMICIDCHTSYEIMGDGNYALHKEDQMKIRCIDCHVTKEPITKKFTEMDFESKKIAELLGLNDKDRHYLVASKNGDPLVNTFYENGKAYLIKKTSREKVEMKEPGEFCLSGNAHKYLSCNSCHNAWTPQCIGCHTEYDPNSSMYDLLDNKEANGEWLENAKDLLADPAVLGVKEFKNEDGSISKVIDEMMPGMILTINKDKTKNQSSDFKRLYAPSFSHTIRKESRFCESCHNNPLALGYGRGKLEYQISGNVGKWQFNPKYSIAKSDGLPEDAWIGFLKERKNNSATRDNIRTLSVIEQKRILTLGSCLVCHKSNSSIIRATLLSFDKAIQLKSPKCILPSF